jgi:hypothetical protein
MSTLTDDLPGGDALGVVVVGAWAHANAGIESKIAIVASWQKERDSLIIDLRSARLSQAMTGSMLINNPPMIECRRNCTGWPKGRAIQFRQKR